VFYSIESYRSLVSALIIDGMGVCQGICQGIRSLTFCQGICQGQISIFPRSDFM